MTAVASCSTRTRHFLRNLDELVAVQSKKVQRAMLCLLDGGADRSEQNNDSLPSSSDWLPPDLVTVGAPGGAARCRPRRSAPSRVQSSFINLDACPPTAAFFRRNELMKFGGSLSASSSRFRRPNQLSRRLGHAQCPSRRAVSTPVFEQARDPRKKVHAVRYMLHCLSVSVPSPRV